MIKSQAFNLFKYAAMGAIIMFGAAGCADRNKDNVPESAATSNEVKKSLNKAGAALEKGVEKGAELAKDAGSAAKDAATAAKVKTVLLADKKVDAAKLNVDAKGKIIYLRGTARTAQQRSLIVAITQKTMPGYSISNLLKIPGEKPGYTKPPAGIAPAGKAPAATAPGKGG